MAKVKKPTNVVKNKSTSKAQKTTNTSNLVQAKQGKKILKKK